MTVGKYMEDCSFELPNIKDGVQQLGDLWDCTTDTPLRLNLFSKNLNDEHLRAVERGDQKFVLEQIRSSEDKIKSLHVDGEIAISLMSGMIKIKGSCSFDNVEKSEKLYEKLTIQYYVENYIIEILPSAKDIMDKIVLNKLSNNEIRATHVVSRVAIGAHIDASIQVCTSDTDKTTDINGKPSKLI
jgi:hypothetical protein